MILPRRLTWWLVATLALVALLGAAWMERPAAGVAAGEAASVPVLAASSEATPSAPMYYVKTTERVMGLTFDISWGTKAPAEVLGVLRDYHLRATFFLSGPWSYQHSDVVSAVAKDGHEIANHGQEHVNLSQRSES